MLRRSQDVRPACPVRRWESAIEPAHTTKALRRMRRNSPFDHGFLEAFFFLFRLRKYYAGLK